MIYLLDTNGVSDAIREHPKLDARLAVVPATDQLATSTIVRGEILFGIERLPAGKRRDDLTVKAQQVLARMVCHAVTEPAADHYARIKRDCQLKGLPLDTNDLWIAATAILLDAVLVTRDVDFRNVDRLRTEDWTV